MDALESRNIVSGIPIQQNMLALTSESQVPAQVNAKQNVHQEEDVQSAMDGFLDFTIADLVLSIINTCMIFSVL